MWGSIRCAPYEIALLMHISCHHFNRLLVEVPSEKNSSFAARVGSEAKPIGRDTDIVEIDVEFVF